MYRYIDLLRIMAVGLAAAVIMTLTSHEECGPEAVRNCLLFPQFTQAAAADRSVPVDGEEMVFSFRIAELFEEMFG